MESSHPSQALQPRRSGRGGIVTLISGYRPHRYPKVTATLLLWLLGLWFMLLAKPLYQPSEEEVKAFEAKLKEVESLDAQVAGAYKDWVHQEAEIRDLKVWFWRWREPHRERVLARQPAVDAAKARVEELQTQQEKLFSDAKAQLGLWSEAGVGESRQLFWESFQGGKVFAQRQTFWDSLFSILGSRDRDWLGLLLQLLFTTLVNFTVGLSVSIFVFLAQLPRLLLSYQPSWWSAFLFFAAAATGAVSVVASFLGLLYAAGATAVYSTISLVDASRRLEGGPGGQRRRIADGQAPHEE